jgi:hypothetical protein
LAPFSSPQQTTDASGLTAQSAPVTQANASAAADPVSQVISAALQALQALAANPAAIIPDDLTALDIIAATGTSLNSTYYMEAFAGGVIGAENNLGMLPKATAAAAADVAPVAPALAAAPQLGGGAGLGNVTAVLARGGTIGPVSVPASWVAPSSGRVAALPPNGFTTIPGTEEAAAAGYPGYPGMPAGTGARSSGVGAPPRYGVRPTVMPRSPAAG